MAGRTKKLTSNQSELLFQAMVMRNSDFLEACFSALGADRNLPNATFEYIYEKLAKGEWSKLRAIDQLLRTSGLEPLCEPTKDPLRYNIDQLLKFAPEDDQKFAAMIIDLAADRSPTPDEALQNLQLAGDIAASNETDSQRSSNRRKLLSQILERYSDTLTFEGEDIVRRPRFADSTICKTWSGGLYLHPDTVLHSSKNEDSDSFDAMDGPVLSCHLPLVGGRAWQLRFELEHCGQQELQIEVQCLAQERSLLRVSAMSDLIGTQTLPVSTDEREIRVVVSFIKGQTPITSTLTPVLLEVVAAA